ncbi:hypothetical protein QWY87_02005 [Lutimonas halocynthiae]|uniref:hypothetical protein n=1 Tax=Lutimonas halocynthiae TaxID=1446477 RepID=UPI0025B311C8|nr:hypothetical protein [Lutimonas halocynthiae]MDN3641458.1 hypothetical protein [Lutimonas halocynthiae]
MEFFRVLEVKTEENEIQKRFDFHNLESMSNELFLLELINKNEAHIGSLWGEFTLQRTVIKGGLRFALLECPNALAWTITIGYDNDEGSVMIHATINRKKKNQEFIDEIDEFLDDHSELLKKSFDEKKVVTGNNKL